jgi:hypothetical protein
MPGSINDGFNQDPVPHSQYQPVQEVLPKPIAPPTAPNNDVIIAITNNGAPRPQVSEIMSESDLDALADSIIQNNDIEDIRNANVSIALQDEITPPSTRQKVRKWLAIYGALTMPVDCIMGMANVNLVASIVLTATTILSLGAAMCPVWGKSLADKMSEALSKKASDMLDQASIVFQNRSIKERVIRRIESTITKRIQKQIEEEAKRATAVKQAAK